MFAACRWSAIAGHLDGRTDNEIKNYWNTHLKKRYNGVPFQIRKPSYNELFNSGPDPVASFLNSTYSSCLSHMMATSNAQRLTQPSGTRHILPGPNPALAFHPHPHPHSVPSSSSFFAGPAGQPIFTPAAAWNLPCSLEQDSSNSRFFQLRDHNIHDQVMSGGPAGPGAAAAHATLPMAPPLLPVDHHGLLQTQRGLFTAAQQELQRPQPGPGDATAKMHLMNWGGSNAAMFPHAMVGHEGGPGPGGPGVPNLWAGAHQPQPVVESCPSTDANMAFFRALTAAAQHHNARPWASNHGANNVGCLGSAHQDFQSFPGVQDLQQQQAGNHSGGTILDLDQAAMEQQQFHRQLSDCGVPGGPRAAVFGFDDQQAGLAAIGSHHGAVGSSEDIKPHCTTTSIWPSESLWHHRPPVPAVRQAHDDDHGQAPAAGPAQLLFPFGQSGHDQMLHPSLAMDDHIMDESGSSMIPALPLPIMAAGTAASFRPACSWDPALYASGCSPCSSGVVDPFPPTSAATLVGDCLLNGMGQAGPVVSAMTTPLSLPLYNIGTAAHAAGATVTPTPAAMDHITAVDSSLRSELPLLAFGDSFLATHQEPACSGAMDIHGGLIPMPAAATGSAAAPVDDTIQQLMMMQDGTDFPTAATFTTPASDQLFHTSASQATSGIPAASTSDLLTIQSCSGTSSMNTTMSSTLSVNNSPSNDVTGGTWIGAEDLPALLQLPLLHQPGQPGPVAGDLRAAAVAFLQGLGYPGRNSFWTGMMEVLGFQKPS